MLLSRIITDRLVLEPVPLGIARAVVAGDVSALRAADGWPQVDTVDAMRIAIEPGGGPAWFITLAGEIIGECGTITPPDESGAVEIGYGLAEPFRKQGYATEAVGGLCAWLFAQPDIKIITAGVLIDNPASRRVLDKLEFVPGPEHARHVMYALTAPVQE